MQKLDNWISITLQKSRASDQLRLSHLCGNIEIFWALLSRTQFIDTYMYSAVLIFLKSTPIHKNREKGLTISKLKKKLTVPPRQRCQNFDQAKPAQKNTKIQNSARSSILPCSLGLTGHDPQGGTTMEALCKFLLLMYQN